MKWPKVTYEPVATSRWPVLHFVLTTMQVPPVNMRLYWHPVAHPCLLLPAADTGRVGVGRAR